MYENVFGFSDRPFTSTPFVKHYFAASAIAQTFSQTQMCIERASGPVIVIGETGTGKTLLLNLIAELYQDRFDVVNLACARLDQRSDLLQSILFELNQPYRDMAEGELRLALIDFLKPGDNSPNGVLLLIDEANSLSPGLMDEIRLITNFVRDGQPRVRLVIAGNHRLEEKLTDPKLESFNQRIAARCYLQNLSYDETLSYVQAHLERAGGLPGQLFADNAYQAIYEVSDGCPRLINQVCEHSFILAATRGIQLLNEDTVNEAWRDLQSIPGTWTEQDAANSITNLEQNEQWTVLEFGSLDDENPDATEASDIGAYEIATAEEQESFTHVHNDDLDSAEVLHDDVSEQPEEFIQSESIADVDPVLDNEISREVYQLEEQTSMEPDATYDWAAEHSPEPDTDSLSGNKEVGNEYYVETETHSDGEYEIAVTETSENEPDGPGQLEPAFAMDDGTSKHAMNPTREEHVAEVESPFEEEYEEEEFLIDQYVPLVAQQNRSSLTVTASQLESLRPPQKSISLEELQADLLGEDALQEVHSTADADLSNISPFDDDVAAAQELPDNVDALAVSQMGGPEAQEAFIQRRVEEILANMDLPPQDESEFGNSEGPSIGASQYDELSDEVTVVAFEPSQPIKAAADLTDESERILTEIESQQEILSSALDQDLMTSGDDMNEPESPESVSIEYPVSPHETFHSTSQGSEMPEDDRDMIIVSRAEQRSPANEDDASYDEVDQGIPSTGRALRMEYQQLFEQLRELPTEE